MPNGSWDQLALEESLDADSRRVQEIFNRDGGGDGMRTNILRRDPNYKLKLLEAMTLVERVARGERRGILLFEEAMTSSDFPLLFGDILERETLAIYRQIPSNWDRLIQTREVNSFRLQQVRYPLSGTQSQLARVEEREEYPEASLSETAPFTYRVYKYGRRFAMSWETFINDEQGEFLDLPGLLALAARRTEMYQALALFLDANGPHASAFTAGNTNIINIANGAIADNPPLALAGLQDGLLVLGNQVDEYGEPIAFDIVYLVVPPALEITARNILNATELEIGLVGQGSNAAALTENRIRTLNWMKNRVQLEVMPHIPLVATAANGNTSWFLFGSVQAEAQGTARQFGRLAFLRGRREPEIFMKASNAVRVGGGPAGPEEGDFDTDSRQWKVRHVLGATRIDPRAAVSSNGSGS